MNEELDKQLMRDFPTFFSQRGQPMWKTCMCWGFACGDGWEPLIRMVAEKVEAHNNSLDIKKPNKVQQVINNIIDWIDLKIMEYRMTLTIKKPKRRLFTFWLYNKFNAIFYGKLYTHIENYIEATQVKEKFGTLRIYTNHGTDEIYDEINTAEELSATTCEGCGSRGKRRTGSWIRTLCDRCNKK